MANVTFQGSGSAIFRDTNILSPIVIDSLHSRHGLISQSDRWFPCSTAVHASTYRRSTPVKQDDQLINHALSSRISRKTKKHCRQWSTIRYLNYFIFNWIDKAGAIFCSYVSQRQIFPLVEDSSSASTGFSPDNPARWWQVLCFVKGTREYFSLVIEQKYHSVIFRRGYLFR